MAFREVQILNKYHKVVIISIETALIKYKLHIVSLQDCYATMEFYSVLLYLVQSDRDLPWSFKWTKETWRYS